MAERPKYGSYDIPGRPTDADFDELWAYIRAVHGGTCSGHWYDPRIDSWVLIHTYVYRRGADPRATRLQSIIYVHQRFFAACRERHLTIAQGLESVQLAEAIREALPRASRLTISDMDYPIAIEPIKN